ncbi:MAG: CDP-alcohol phosphatidyltransferase family protein [bacterium]
MAGALKVPKAANPANLLTLLRLVLAPVLAMELLERHWGGAFAAFALASGTDFLDGWLARAYGWTTPLGSFVDPLADKVLQLTAFTLLAVEGVCPPWVAILAWTRELMVVAGFTLLALVDQPARVRVSPLGKLGAFCQMGALALLLGLRSFSRNPVAVPLAVLALAVTVLLNFVAGLEYVLKGLKAREDRP